MTGMLRIRDPRVDKSSEHGATLPTLSSLTGKTLAILNNGWTSMDRIADQFAQALKSRYGIREVLNFSVPIGNPAEQSLFDDAVKRADFSLVGLAN